MQDLIVVKQLPQIEEHLKELSIDIDKKFNLYRRKCKNDKTSKSRFEQRV